MTAETPFPQEAFAEAARAYRRRRDLGALASGCGVRKPGYRLPNLAKKEVAALFAEHVAKNSYARKKALKELAKEFGDPADGLRGEPVAALRAGIEAARPLSAGDRAAWIIALLRDPRPEAWVLIDLLDEPAAGGKPARKKTKAPAAREAKRERDEARRRAKRAETERDRARGEVEKQGAELEKTRAQRDRLAGETRRLREETAREVRLRKQAEREAAAAARTAARAEKDAAARRSEVLALRGKMQVADAPRMERDLRALREAHAGLEERHAAMTRDYSALLHKLRRLQDRLAGVWSEGGLEPKDFRPLDPKESLVLEPPLHADERPAADKVRIPSDPHHWPAGYDRFERFLTRLARSPHVTRVIPRRFKGIVRHEISFVTEEGDLLAQVTDGSHTALVLVLTTATHRGQGEFVRRALAPQFESGKL